jgi:putative ABC transport system permease protein
MVMNWWQRLFRARQLEQELDKELQFHVDQQTADNRSAGMSEQDARRTTRLSFGGIPQVKEDCRESRGTLWVSSVAQDIRFTLRTLARDRGFTIVAVLILALGIGANIVVFSVVNTLLLRPLPFHDAQLLVWITGNNGQGGLSDTAYRVDWWQAYQRNNQTMQNVTGFVPYLSIGETKLMNYGDPRPIKGVWVLADFFQTLGVQPALGRLFTREEGAKGGRPAILLAYPFWRTQFHADPNILGQSITLNKNAYTIVGVLPETFDFGAVFAPGSKMDYFIPAVPENMANWGHVLALVGRMKPGVTVAQAQSEANTLFPHLRSTLKLDGDTDYKTNILSLKDEVSGKLRRSLIVLWCAVGLILLIVCVNLSNLLLARAASRSREFGLRVALGARRTRLVRQLLTESLVLSGVGALLGLGFAYAATAWLAHQGSVALPLMSSVRVDQTALAWTVTLAVAVGLLFGIVPGLKMSAGNLQETLKDSGQGTSDGRRHERMRSLLVISEVALACVLLVGAGLLLRSFLQVMSVDLGFRPEQASAIRMDTDPNYDDNTKGGDERGVLFRDVIRQVSALPGVQAVGITDSLPLEKGRSWDLHAVGRPTKPGENLDAFVYIATPGTLNALGIHLREGRDFTWADTPKSQHVIIINQTAAHREWPNQNPIGKFARGVGDGETTVIGVIDDVRDTSAEAPSNPEVYIPVTQGEPVKAEVIVRSALPTSVLAPGIMRILRSINPQQAAVELRPIQTMVDHATSPRRFFAILVALFAALGLLLASLGIYGVISYSVSQQTQEIGIRMALGATREQVHRRVLWNTLHLTIAGVAVGTLSSVAMARAIATLLFGTAPTDPITFSAMILLLLSVALLAGYLPAQRASRIDPLKALRCN